MKQVLTSESAFQQTVERILKLSSADDTFITMSDSNAGTLRFANNQVVQHVSVRSPRLTVRAAFGRKTGSSSTNRIDQASLKETVYKAERIAKLAPEDPEYMSPLPRQEYNTVPSYNASTEALSPMDLATRTKPVIDACFGQQLVGAGIMSNSSSVRGVAASSGLFGYERSSDARFSLTASGEDSSGWTYNAHRDCTQLGIKDRTHRAVSKAILSREPREIPAGHYPVILEPAAVAGIFGPLLWSLGAKSYYRGDSALAGKLGSLVLDAGLSVASDPENKDLLGGGFAGNGLATTKRDWIANGVLKHLYYDRFTAQEHNVEPTARPSAIVLSHNGPRVGSVDDLISQTKRAILITNFWYIRSVNRRDITVTGMTRDGTFLVEDGKIVSGLRNFRFHESPLRCFKDVEASTSPMEAITLERGKMLLPAFKLPDFYLSSVTKF